MHFAKRTTQVEKICLCQFLGMYPQCLLVFFQKLGGQSPLVKQFLWWLYHCILVSDMDAVLGDMDPVFDRVLSCGPLNLHYLSHGQPPYKDHRMCASTSH